MKDWDELSREERANLTKEQVEAYIRVFAMEDGVVLGVEFEDLIENTEEPQLDTELKFQVSCAEQTFTGFLFNSEVQAKAFIALVPLTRRREYIGDGYGCVVEHTQVPTEMKVEPVSVSTEKSVAMHREALEKSAAIVEQNKKNRERRDEFHRHFSRVSSPIWREWSDDKDYLTKLENIRACYEEYKSLAKDEASAITCINKAFPDMEILNDALGKGWNVLPGIAEEAVSAE